MRLIEIKQRLNELGAIPGIHDVYEKKLDVLYYVAKAHRAYLGFEKRIAEIDFDIEQLREESELLKGGAILGVTQHKIEQLEEEREELDALLNGVSDPEELADIEHEIDALKSEGEDLRQEIRNKPTTEHAQRLQEIEEQLDELQFRAYGRDQLGEGAVFERLKLINEYAETYSKSRMVEVPSFKKIAEEGLEHLRNHQPFLLAGHLGSGKTEIAKHIARLYMLENGVGFDVSREPDPDKVYDMLQPEFFSGGEESSVYDLVGKLKLVGRSSDDPEFISRRVEELKKGLAEANIVDVPDNELVKILMGKGDVTETSFNYGPFGRALRDGKPIIIDEINLIPPDVIGRINDVLLRGVGDEVRLQENGEEALKIKPGFAVIATCNLGEKYEGIKEVNTAFKSRWVAKEIDYPDVMETYDLILAALVRKDRTRLPPNFPADDLHKLADLAIVTREIQELFSGQTEGQRFMSMTSSVVAEKSQLHKGVVSTRDLMRKIIAPWKKNDFNIPLEDIIARYILAGEVLARESKEDQKLMAEIFMRRGFFGDWDQARFEEFGIRDISDQEINTLHAQFETDEYKQEDAKWIHLASKAREHVRGLQADLLVGNKDMMEAQRSNEERGTHRTRRSRRRRRSGTRRV